MGTFIALNKIIVNYSHFVCALPEHVLPLFSTPREKVHCCGELFIRGEGGGELKPVTCLHRTAGRPSSKSKRKFKEKKLFPSSGELKLITNLRIYGKTEFTAG